MEDFLAKAQAVAVAAAKEAGKVLMLHFRHQLSIEFKGGSIRNLVTNADRAADSIIQKRIRKAFPGHGIASEESAPTDGEYVWHIDPLDGTTNYSRGSNQFCVAIGLRRGKQLLVGVVYNPVASELYTAITGRGAFLNGKRIAVSEVPKLNSSIVYCDMGYEDNERKKMLQILNGIAFHVKSIRCRGCGALTTADVAAGRADCYLRAASTPWDYTASTVILREAGGMVTDLKGKGWHPYTVDGIVATNSKIHKDTLKKIAEALR